MTALNGGSGKSTTPKTTQNRCYPTDSEATAAPAGSAGNAGYVYDGMRWNCRIGWHTTALGFGRNVDSPHCWEHRYDVRNITDDHCPLGEQVSK